MDTYRSIFLRLLERDYLPEPDPNDIEEIRNLIESECFNAICKIKKVLEDDRLDDPECFSRIEEIICILEDSGIACCYRHDF